jgi:hypothetical protein
MSSDVTLPEYRPGPESTAESRARVRGELDAHRQDAIAAGIDALSLWLEYPGEAPGALRTLGALAARARIEAGEPAPESLIIESGDWAAAGERPQFVIEGWLPAGRVTLLAGEGGIGKTKLALMLAAAMARGEGTEWLAGGPPLAAGSHGPALYASWEESRDTVRWRLCDWPPAQPGPFDRTLPALLADRFTLLDCARAGPAWAPPEGGSRHTSTLGALTATGEAIRAAAERREARLLVLDPLAACFAGNENDRSIVRGFMADWDGWARETGCTVLLVAHPPKSGAEYSGSTDWYAAARAVWTLGETQHPTNQDGMLTRLECVKASYAKRPEPLALSNWRWWTAAPWPHKVAESPPDGIGAAEGQSRSPWDGDDW